MVAAVPVCEGIPADATLDSVVARAALDVIRPGASKDYVASQPAADYVLAIEPTDDVVPTSSFDEIAFGRPNDRVRLRGAPNHIRRVRGFTASRKGSRLPCAAEERGEAARGNQKRFQMSLSLRSTLSLLTFRVKKPAGELLHRPSQPSDGGVRS